MAVLRIALFAILVVSSATTSAGEIDSLHRAEQAIHEGNARHENPLEARPYFQQAAQEYEALSTAGAHNPSLFRNEGNAYLLAGDLPRAIFAYRRGLCLAPGDPVLRQNLNYAREQVDYPSPDAFGRPPVDHWPPWLPHLTLHWLLPMAVGAYGSGLVMVTRWWMTRKARWLVTGLATLGLAALPVFGVAHEAWQQRQQAKYSLVVLAANRVTLRNGDGFAYPARYDGKTVNRGVEARLLFERGDWLHIELSGGETGWIPRSAVLLDTSGSD
jgi:hypothetical protein